MDIRYRTIARTIYKVADLLSWQRSGSLQLSPVFQRRPSWSNVAKSYLMDTIVRGLPTPIIILREQTDLLSLEPVREVVDGQQRLRTIFSFVDRTAVRDYDEHRDSFTISRTHNPALAGQRFDDLDQALRRRILDYEFSVHVLPADTDDREVLEIFSRLNSSGLKLNPQEIRHAEWVGAFKTLTYELAHEQLNRWRLWKIFSERQIARMAEAEETSDLVVMMLRGVHGQTKAVLDRVYRVKDEEFPESDEVGMRFRRVMDKIDDTVGELVPKTVFRRKAMFHTLFTFYYDSLYGLGSSLLESVKPQKTPSAEVLRKAITTASERISEGNLPEDLAKALRGATSDKATRSSRLDFLRSVVQDVQV